MSTNNLVLQQPVDLAAIKEEYENGRITLTADEAYRLKGYAIRVRNEIECMITDEKEKYAYNMLKKFILPGLTDFVKLRSPKLLELYQGNMCRQASFIACHALKNLLPEWEWDIYEITYSASIFDHHYKCTHAFVIGKKGEEYRAVDMWDNLGPQLYVPIDSVRYPFEYDGVEKNREVINMSKMSYDDMKELDNELLLGDVKQVLRELDLFIYIASTLGL